MQTRKDDHTFPVFDSSGYTYEGSGLTKREFFAAAALQGLLASPSLNDENYRPYEIACAAVEAADLLIIRLNETSTNGAQ